MPRGLIGVVTGSGARLGLHRNGAPLSAQVWAKKASASEPLMTCRNWVDGIETGAEPELGMSAADACLLAGRCPAWRRRELGLGFDVERGNLSSRARG